MKKLLFVFSFFTILLINYSAYAKCGKVRIGDFIDRRKAENLRKEMIKEGYTSAWIIRTRIKPKVE